MSVEDLYQEIILEHFRHSQRRGSVANPSAQCQLFNPLCGDQVQLSLRIEAGKVKEVRFDGHGCSISQASASMMASMLEGVSIEEARARIENFRRFMRGEPVSDEVLGDLVSFSGVRKYATRIKCAHLAWEAAEKCLDQAAAKAE